MKDRELIQRIQNGQKEYLNEIAEKYYDDIYYFCCYQTGSREEAYDLAQETFLRFIRYVEVYRDRNLKGYLLTIAMNLCREYFRRTAQVQKREKRMGFLENDEAVEIEKNIGYSQQAAAETVLLLEEAFLLLPDFQREAVLLHYFYGYKNREIALMMGISYAAAKSRVSQGIKKLHQLLDQKDFRDG